MRRATLLLLLIAGCGAVYLSAGSGFFGPRSGDRASDPVAIFSLFVDTRSELGQWEEAGLGLSAHFGGDGRVLFNNDLVSITAIAAVRAAVSDDLRRSREAFSKIQESYGHKPRFFPVEWLDSPRASFALTSVVLRPDRIHAGDNVCGELRFIYRLGYDLKAESGEPVSSDLPMSLNVVYELPPADCGGQLRQLAAVLASGGDASAKLRTYIRGTRPVRLEYNFQINRYPHDGSADFSDQAHYGLAVLKPAPESPLHWERSPLENTPDLGWLAKDDAMRADLWTWINVPENSRRIASGVFQIPERFLARSAVAVTPNGILRLTNRPFAQLFAGADFKLGGGTDFTDKSELLRRLDEATCTGCHVSRSVAGFHGLGQARNTEGYFNRMLTPMSGYFYAIQPWRRSVFDAVTGGSSTEAAIAAQPMPPPGRLTAYAAACGRPGGAFSSWTCGEGLSCNTEMPGGSLAETGLCLPDKTNYTGAPCDQVFLASDPFSLRDKWQEITQKGCDLPNLCTKSIFGFPGGFCTTGCSDEPDTAGERCSDIPRLGPFTECLEAGGSFAGCLATSHARVLMPKCRSHNDCRPDYLCAAAETTGESAGICTPQYFLHQLTIENHPL